MTLDRVEAVLASHGLANLGALHPDQGGTIVLVGPDTGFWQVFRAAPESRDGHPDPLDRWSRRTLDLVASSLGATSLYPFTGPPWHPFPAWALATGHAFRAPNGLLVHATAGLWLSFRGALHFPERLPLPPPPANPCTDCPEQPCRRACPVDALQPDAYDTAACHAFLDTAPGRACLTNGCAARAACPVSRRHGRDPAQSAFHMAAFHR